MVNFSEMKKIKKELMYLERQLYKSEEKHNAFCLELYSIKEDHERDREILNDIKTEQKRLKISKRNEKKDNLIWLILSILYISVLVYLVTKYQGYQKEQTLCNENNIEKTDENISK